MILAIEHTKPENNSHPLIGTITSIYLQHKGKHLGQDLVSRKYNPRTRQWDVKVIKLDKGYEYIPVLIAKILRRRMEDFDYVTRNVSLNESDPALIAPTISHIPPPPMKEIIQKEEQVFKRITLKPNGQNE